MQLRSSHLQTGRQSRLLGNSPLRRCRIAPSGDEIAMLGSEGGRGSKRPARQRREDVMADSVYKVIELIGTSKDSWEKAAKTAVDRASKSLRELRVAEVVQLDMQLDAKGKVEAYRAKIKVSFKFEGS